MGWWPFHAEIEAVILAYSFDFSTHECLRVAQEIALKGITVSAVGVRGI
jgi:hypothetical protein